MTFTEDLSGEAMRLARSASQVIPAADGKQVCPCANSSAEDQLGSQSTTPTNNHTVIAACEPSAKALTSPNRQLDSSSSSNESPCRPSSTVGTHDGIYTPSNGSEFATTQKNGTLLAWLKSTKKKENATVEVVELQETSPQTKPEDFTKCNTGAEVQPKATRGAEILLPDDTKAARLCAPERPPLEPVFDVSKIGSMFTFRAGSPLGGVRLNQKQPASYHGITPDLSQDGTAKIVEPAKLTTPAVPVTNGTKLQESQPYTPARPSDHDRSQSTSAITGNYQTPPPPSTHQLLSPTTGALVRYHSETSIAPATPVPKIELVSSEAGKDISDSVVYQSISSTRPTTPSTPIGLSAPGCEGGDSFFLSSPPASNAFSPENENSFYGRLSPEPHSHRCSVSSALICSPPPGELDLIWNWKPTERRTQNRQAFYWIVHELCRDLNKPEVPPGYIYAFKINDARARDCIKIGVSEKLEIRMKTHERCYGKVERIYPPEGEVPVPVRHAVRVEKLIHAELIELGMVLGKCPKLGTKHTAHGEWFKSDENHAVAVIRKWSEWISGRPYVQETLDEDCDCGKRSRRNSNADGSAKVLWKLGVLERNVVMNTVWPMDPWANTSQDDDGLGEVGRGMGLLAV